MQHLSTAFLITALAIVVNEGVVNAQNVTGAELAADESKNRAVTIVDGPKQESPPIYTPSPEFNQTNSPEIRPPSKPPIQLSPDKKIFFDVPHHFYNQKHKHHAPPLHFYTKEQVKYSNPRYKYPRTVHVQRGNVFYKKGAHPSRKPIIFAPPSGKPMDSFLFSGKSPKFSLPVQTINGIRTEFVKPPNYANITTTTTTSTIAPSTTTKVLRTKRIWPKRILEKLNGTTFTSSNVTFPPEKITLNGSDTTTDLASLASRLRVRYIYSEKSVSSTTLQPTTRGYRRVTRTPKIRPTTPLTFGPIASNDWVPIVPSHFAKIRKHSQTPISRRSDTYFDNQPIGINNKRFVNLQYGLLPVGQQLHGAASALANNKIFFFRKKKRQQQQQEPYLYQQNYNNKKLAYPQISNPESQLNYEDLQTDQSQHQQQKVVTQIKHHHHHHHHRYVKTVEKPVKVPYKVEVPKPYPVEKKVSVPVPVEKIKVVDRPYPVTVEKKVPYPVHVKVPHPVPYKVVEKQYVPRPYPVIQRVPVIQQVQVKVPHPVPVHVEKKVPYPVQVPFTVEKQVPVPVRIVKRIPYPVPYKVYVPQPFPIEKKIPYPVEIKVKEPYEVIKHVHVKVPILQPYPVKVPQPIPITIEKRVPFPIRVEKKIPVPVEVLVPHKVEVEKKVPVYIPKPYPVEKRVPYPVKVPYPIKVPVKVPVRVPVEVPVYIPQHFQMNDHDIEGVGEHNIYGNHASESPYYGDEDDINRSGAEKVISSTPGHTVTVHGNTGYNSFRSRSDTEVTTPAPSSTSKII